MGNAGSKSIRPRTHRWARNGEEGDLVLEVGGSSIMRKLEQDSLRVLISGYACILICFRRMTREVGKIRLFCESLGSCIATEYFNIGQSIVSIAAPAPLYASSAIK